jgi:hypothetical protein
MVERIDLEEPAARRHQRARRAGKESGRTRWQAEDAARFLFKGQSYDAGARSETHCNLCGGPIRLCYVLKVIEDPSVLYSREVGKLHIGECCFQSIRAVNEKLYGQLLAAAVNLRTFLEAIERDQRIFAVQEAATETNEGKSPHPPLVVPPLDEEFAVQLFEALEAGKGGNHA